MAAALTEIAQAFQGTQPAPVASSAAAAAAAAKQQPHWQHDLALDSTNPRYAHVSQLLTEAPDVAEYAHGLALTLQRQHYVVVDRVLDDHVLRQFIHEVKSAHRDGNLKPGQLAGGRAGANTKYVLGHVRGDQVGWFNQDPCHDSSSGRAELAITEETASDPTPTTESAQADRSQPRCWQGSGLRAFTSRMNTLVQLIAAFVPELQRIESRSEAMITCYPGNSTRYIRHCDNPHRNGRKLTVLFYLNEEWQPGDGGEVRLFVTPDEHQHAAAPADSDDETEASASPTPSGSVEQAVTIPPRANTMVIFFSDRRVPHEVLPTNVPRFAATHWFYDADERAEAEASAGTAFELDQQIEEERIRREIEKFEATQAQAQMVPAKNQVNSPRDEPMASDVIAAAATGGASHNKPAMTAATTAAASTTADLGMTSDSGRDEATPVSAPVGSPIESASDSPGHTPTAWSHRVQKSDDALIVRVDTDGLPVEVHVDNEQYISITVKSQAPGTLSTRSPLVLDAKALGMDATTLSVKHIAKSGVIKLKAQALRPGNT